ncbi:NF-kappa-B-activating protein-like [Oopsacas minuta]|uniref:NF-kappa-B-activating protein-like n=1 Tax=Oopsacas minuta TaxID=111878 RepID=A0AAV7K831_9METZ|nr:NF-kappa-B-activating protein-like [Oopsacas minuta]
MSRRKGSWSEDRTESYLKRRRETRNRIAESKDSSVWGKSPKYSSYISSESDDSVIGAMSIDRAKKYRKSIKGKKRKKEKKLKKKRRPSALDSERIESESQAVSEILFEQKREEQREASPVFGPHHPDTTDATGGPSRMDYGAALLPGEGEAMAQYVAEGKRIPRRGEIGLTSNEIVAYEDVGFVMSGSRHRRMEAVRLRKENQIYNADEGRALLMFNYEERSKREEKLLTEFKEMVQKRVQANQQK